MSSQATLWATDAATSSPGSADGRSRCDSLNGPTTCPSGQAPAPANLSARQAKALGLLTSGTCGPHGSGSSSSVSLATSVANRLRQEMRCDGGILWRLTWKGRATPARRWIYQRQASARRTSAAGCSGWPTPCQQDGPKGGPSQGSDRLPSAAHLVSPWPTPQLSDRTGGGQAKRATNPARSNDLNDFALLVSSWPTPNTLDTIDRDGMRPSRIATNRDSGYLTEIVVRVAWPTPNTPSGGRSMAPEKMDATGRTLATGWATPASRDYKDSPGMATHAMNPDGSERIRLDQLPRQAALTHGPTASGSTAPTGKRGQLNPAFSRWLQGYPASWCQAAIRASRMRTPRRKRALVVSGDTETPSFRKQQRKSSARGRR